MGLPLEGIKAIDFAGVQAGPPGPFSGLLVVDLTHILNGPYGTTILADLGARVIKVEPPGHGDDTRTYGPFVKGQSLYFSFVNRGKESIVLNLKDDHDRGIFRNMVRRADVVAENFRPGTMDRLGFSYAELSKDNPAPDLRLLVRLRPDRVAQGLSRLRHHRPSHERPHEHHRLP